MKRGLFVLLLVLVMLVSFGAAQTCDEADFDSDGDVDQDDADALEGMIGESGCDVVESDCYKYDLNDNSVIDTGDWSFFLGCFDEPVDCSRADVDEDGDVDKSDVKEVLYYIPSFDCEDPASECYKYDVSGDGKVLSYDRSILNACLTGICSDSDFDNDGDVDRGDLTLFQEHWLATGCDDYTSACYIFDLDSNGNISGGDLGLFAGCYAPSCDDVDFDNDGDVDEDDSNALQEMLGSEGCTDNTNDCFKYDVNNNGVIDTADWSFFLGCYEEQQSDCTVGDFDEDGDVDRGDFLDLREHFGMANCNLYCARADVNQDGLIDGLDGQTILSKLNEEGCSDENDWCDRADINRDGQVRSDDQALVRNAEDGCESPESGCWDYDLNRDGVVGIPDFNMLRECYEMSCDDTDFDSDGDVDRSDLELFQGHWLEEGCTNLDSSCYPYDLDNNGNISGGDLGLFAGCYEPSCNDTDFDNDGDVDVFDRTQFLAALSREETDCMASSSECFVYDINANGVVDTGDWAYFLGCWESEFICDDADFDVDGDIDRKDLMEFNQHFGETDCAPATSACHKYDLNRDGVVGIPDFNSLRSCYEPSCSDADFSGDGDVDRGDLILFHVHWQETGCDNTSSECYLFDLDNNGVVAGGDLGFFAGCYESSCDDADLDGDGVVDRVDSKFFVDHWLEEGCGDIENTCYAGDLDNNGKIGGGDLGLFVGCYEMSCNDVDFDNDGTVGPDDANGLESHLAEENCGDAGSACYLYDVNANGVVDTGDWAYFLSCYSPEEFVCDKADFDHDGTVDGSDLDLFHEHWLETGCDDLESECYSFDLDGNGVVAGGDLGLFAGCYTVSGESCEEGCLLGGDNCVPVGHRKSGEYCAYTGELLTQHETGSFCENNFECEGNYCVSDECISKGLLQRLIDWFKRLFGAD